MFQRLCLRSAKFLRFTAVAAAQSANSPWPILKALLMLGGILLVTKEATAETCGHYLFKNGVPVGITAPRVVLPLQMTAEQSAPLVPLVPVCNGPGCRRQSVPLAPPAVPGIRLLTSDPAVLLRNVLISLSRSGWFPIPRSERVAAVSNAEIFRPPTA